MVDLISRWPVVAFGALAVEAHKGFRAGEQRELWGTLQQSQLDGRDGTTPKITWELKMTGCTAAFGVNADVAATEEPMPDCGAAIPENASPAPLMPPPAAAMDYHYPLPL